MVVSKVAPTNYTEGPIIESEYLPETEKVTSDVPLPKDTVLEEQKKYTPEEQKLYDLGINSIERLQKKINEVEGLAMQDAATTGKEWGKLNRQERNAFREALLEANPEIVKRIIKIVTIAKVIDFKDVFGDAGYSQFIDDTVSLVSKYLYIRDAGIPAIA